MARYEIVRSEAPSMDWPRVRAWLSEAIKQSERLPEEIFHSLVVGQSYLWLVFKQPEVEGAKRQLVAAITSILERSLVGASCVITYCGGEGAQEWAEQAVNVISDDAIKEHGCTKTVIIGRQGWQKLLSGVGFKQTSVILVRDEMKRVEDGNQRDISVQPGLRGDI